MIPPEDIRDAEIDNLKMLAVVLAVIALVGFVLALT